MSPNDSCATTSPKDLAARLGIQWPILCGAMFPCGNPELIAAVSAAGGMGIVQPIAVSHVWGHSLSDALRQIRAVTPNPVGMNVLVEKSSRVFEQRMLAWTDEALALGVRFFVTSLGNPVEIVERAHAHGGLVFHAVTERRWAERAMKSGIDGLIAVNRDAGGHAGGLSAEKLFTSLRDLGLPILAAGGIGDPASARQMLDIGYAGIQMGTRFIATSECKAPDAYKQAIVDAAAADIVHTERVTGVPLAVIRTPHVMAVGLRAGPLGRFLLRGRKTRHWMRFLYNVVSAWRQKRAMTKGHSTRDYWQAGRSVAHIHDVSSAGDIVRQIGAVFP